MAKSIFASQAVVGMRYLTKNNLPILILEHAGKDAQIKDELTGRTMKMYGDQLLYPYKKGTINKEAITMAKTLKAAEKDTVRASSLDYVKGKRKIERMYKGKKYEVAVTQDGFRWGSQTFTSLSAVALAITKRPEVDGPRFFGLRKAA